MQEKSQPIEAGFLYMCHRLMNARKNPQSMLADGEATHYIV